MNQKEKRNTFFPGWAGDIQKKLQSLYDDELVSDVKKHNEDYPEQALTYNGFYWRTVYVWLEDREEYQEIRMTVTRLRLKGTNRSFTYQGSILAPHSKYLRPQMMELIAGFLQERTELTVEGVCNHRGLAISVFRRWLAALTGFLRVLFPTVSSVTELYPSCFSDMKTMDAFCRFFRKGKAYPEKGLFMSELHSLRA